MQRTTFTSICPICLFVVRARTVKRNISIAINWVPNEVSSTLARRYLRRGLSVKYMLDDHVVEYIRQQKLYAVDTM